MSKYENRFGFFLYDRDTNRLCGIKHPDGSEELLGLVNVSVGTPVDGVKATLTSDMTNANADIYLTAVNYGVEGNLISIVYVDPSAASQSLAVTVKDQAISVSLATNSGSTITSTAAQVVAAITAHPVASTLVAVTYEGTGAGVVNAKTVALLTGGVTCTPGVAGSSFMIDSAGTSIYRKSTAYSWVRCAVGAAATTSVDGVVELATNTETQTGTDATRAVTPAGLTSRTATDARTGIAELATLAETLAGTDASRIVTPINLAAAQAVISNPKATSQAIYMTYAASGSTGIQVTDNDNIDFGTGNFFLCVVFKLPVWPPTESLRAFYKFQDADNRWSLDLLYTGYVSWYSRVTAGVVHNSLSSSAVIPATSGNYGVLFMVMQRETASSAGLISWYWNGYLFGTSVITAAATVDISNSGILNIFGDQNTGKRYSSNIIAAAVGNFAPTADEVLSTFRSGSFPVKWRKASQTALTSGTLVTGQEYIIDTYVSDDDFSNIATVVSGTINTTGCRFVATGTTPTKWTNSSSLRAIGTTALYEPEGAQPAPGQWLDSSSNKLHAMQPATGSSLVRSKKDFEYRWTNTWTASSAAQYVGGVYQNVLSADHHITSISTQATVTTDIKNLELGDGSDVDHFVAAFTPSATRTNQTIANQNDGTNLKLVYTPAAEATMTVETIIRGFIWEP